MTPTFADLLRRSRLRVTRPRLAVLAEVAAHPHVDAEHLRSAVREQLGSVSTQAVYDVLNTLTGAGILRRIEPAGSPGRYELATGDNHHHLVCRGCGTVHDVPCQAAEGPCLHLPGGDHGYVIDEAEVIFWGLCPACRQAGGTAG